MTSAVVAPSGKPTTEHTPTPRPRNNVEHVATHVGIHAHGRELELGASRQSSSISWRVASGLSRVWSISDAIESARAAGGVQADPRRAGIKHAPKRSGQQSSRTEWHAHNVLERRRCRGHFLDDDIDQAPDSSGVMTADFSSALNLDEPPDVPRLAHGCCDPRRDNRFGFVHRQECGAQGQNIGPVVLARVPGDDLVRGHRRANAANLVRRNRRADSGAVDDDAGVRFPIGHGAADRCRDVRIVDRVVAVGAEIPNREAAAAQKGRAASPSARRRCDRCLWRSIGCPPWAPARRRFRTPVRRR